jgi:hypothetical protein
MRDFGRGAGRLGALDPSAKALYTLWLAFALAHFVFSFAMYWDRTMRDQPARPGGHLATWARITQATRGTSSSRSRFPG